MIPMRFQAYKISGGRGVLKNAPSPGPPSPKTFRIWVGCPDCSSSASLTGIFKKFLVEGFGEAPSYKATPQPILISLNAHWYDTGRPGAAAKYRKGLGGPAQRPRAVQMVPRTIGQSLPPREKRQFLNPDACYGTKSSRLEKKLADSSTVAQVLLPVTLEELWSILAAVPGAALYAGGTDLLVKKRAGLVDSPCLVCLERIDALQGVRDNGEALFIAAAFTHGRILEHPSVRTEFPVLAQALRVLGSPPIRHMGTIGGNIVTASPAGDTLPALYALDAEVEIGSRDHSRRLPIGDLFAALDRWPSTPAKFSQGSGCVRRHTGTFNTTRRWEDARLRPALWRVWPLLSS